MKRGFRKTWCLAFMAAAAAFGSATACADAADWTTYASSLSRAGVATHAGELTAKRVKSLRKAWRTRLVGAINTEPLLAQGVKVGGRRRDLLYVATEHGRVAALDAHTGHVVWQRKLGARKLVSECQPSPDSRFGVTGTMTLERSGGRVYAVDGKGFAWALKLSSGKTAKGWPVRVARPGTSEYVWGALSLSRGRLYAPVASPCDEGSYRGGIVAIDTRHPSQVLRWDALTDPSSNGSGIWGWGGVAIDSGNGDVYAATANADPPAAEDAPFAERVVRLSPELQVKQSNFPLQPPYKIFDRDFGSTPALFHAKGCPRQLVALNKTGEMFLYDSRSIDAGPRQRVVVADVQGEHVPLLGVPTFDAASRTLLVLSPANAPSGTPRRGLVAYRLTADCRLAYKWRARFDAPSSGSQPIVARGIAFAATGGSGWIRANAVSTGHRLWSRRLSTTAFAAPTVVNGAVYAADWDGYVWAFRPAGK